jgi:N-acetylglucosamine-6-phosphate deacetylase
MYVASSRIVVDGVPRQGIVEIGDPGSGSIVRRIELGHDAARIDAMSCTDVGDALLVPAPLDLHFHGAGGITVPPAGSAESIDASLRDATAAADWHDPRWLPAYEWLATLPVPTRPPADPVTHIADAARAIADAGSTRCRGLRIEGLFLNRSRAGVWPPETFRTLDVELLTELCAAAADGGTPLRIVDIAPEIAAPEIVERFIAAAVERDVVVALAHTDASWEQARHAIDCGATLATHLWNAMRPVAHRDPGVIAACLTDERVTSELICDGVHIHTGTIALSTRASQPHGWAVISDASPFAGMPPGPYEWAGTTVHHDGIALHDDTGHLAGSASLAWAARPALTAAGVTETDAALALGAVPRRVLQPRRHIGLHVGDPLWVVRG